MSGNGLDRRELLLGLAAAGGFAAAAPAAMGQPQASGTNGAANGAAGLPPVREMAGVRYRWAFSVSVFFKERVAIEAPYRRAFVPAIGGDIWGPRLQGEVVPYGGADFGGGGGPLDAHYMFRASDGHLIYINNRGYMRRVGWDPSTALDRRLPPLAEGERITQDFIAPADSEVPLRMRTSPFFDAPADSPHDWMNHTLFIGHGLRRMDPDRTVFTYYEVL
ncbi:DUF3237 domain-containing protein [Alteraurantiacibacter palmitatis]|uniref:DUF3237 domain-containing protein n=1 Tax=Alteraurantiacibacter palmitatis TaxID=2054628 RepID=A0ABV7EB30_9SPHN